MHCWPTCGNARTAEAVFEQARRSHLDRIRMYDQFDRGHDSLREQLMAALPPKPARSQADRLARGWRHMGDFVMSIKHHTRRWAAIGLVSAAACIVLAFLLMTFAGGKSAFATAIEQFRNARTIVCHVSSSASVPEGAPEMRMHTTGNLYYSAEYGSRQEIMLNGIMTIIQYTRPDGSTVMVQPMARNYTVCDAQASDDQTRWASNPDAFIRALSRAQGPGHPRIGSQERSTGSRRSDTRSLARRSASAIVTVPGRNSGSMPVRICRFGTWLNCLWHRPAARSRWSTISSSGIRRWTQNLFNPDIPADYTRIDVSAQAAAAVDEAALLKGLQNYADLAGKYPPATDPTTITTDLSSELAQRMAKSMFGRGPKMPDQQTMMQKSTEISVGLKFYQKLISDGCSPEYHGDAVSPGQADAVLLRWKTSRRPVASHLRRSACRDGQQPVVGVTAELDRPRASGASVMDPCQTTRGPMYCRKCGYHLAGLSANRCPECGRVFEPANRRTYLVEQTATVTEPSAYYGRLASCAGGSCNRGPKPRFMLAGEAAGKRAGY